MIARNGIKFRSCEWLGHGIGNHLIRWTVGLVTSLHFIKSEMQKNLILKGQACFPELVLPCCSSFMALWLSWWFLCLFIVHPFQLPQKCSD